MAPRAARTDPFGRSMGASALPGSDPRKTREIARIYRELRTLFRGPRDGVGAVSGTSDGFAAIGKSCVAATFCRR